ncbi:MAG: hypothetical protein K5768_04105 [Firmicutes bacterium]|nr:hypothetical protein [Bacillota bacterium]
MIFQAVFTLVLSIFSSIATIAIPAMPQGFESVLNTVFEYIDTGLKYVWIFIPKNLALQLFQWWISLASLLLTFELILEIWRLITGNVGGTEATSESTTLYTDGQTGEVKTAVMRSTKYKSKRTGLPRF